MPSDRPWKRRRERGEARPEKYAACPFCKLRLERPHTVDITGRSGFVGGACTCGAIFLFDESGGHGGEAIVEVMTAGCGGDWDRAWSLEPEVDYRMVTLSYDPKAHRVSEPGDQYEPEGKLYFFKRLTPEEPPE